MSYIISFLLATIAYIGSFHTPLFSGMDVFFYRGLILIAFWGIVFTGILFLLFKKKWKDTLVFFLVFCCVNTVIFTHLPVTADRSISVFMLGYMNDHAESSFSEEEMAEIFVEKYVKEYGAFEKRFHEQEETGTIAPSNDGYMITEAGKRLIKIYDLTAELFGLDDKMIHSGEKDGSIDNEKDITQSYRGK